MSDLLKPGLSPEDLVKALKSYRLPLSSEADTQRAIQVALEVRAIAHEREYVLSAGNRIDFFIDGGIGLEVKLKGSAKEIFKQLSRYSMFNEITSLVLATNRSMGLPEFINGKPCFYLKLSGAWL